MNYDTQYVSLLVAIISSFAVGLIVGTQLPSTDRQPRDERGRFAKKKAKPHGV